MKAAADILQILLSLPGLWLGLAGCAVVVLLLAQSLKLARCAIQAAKWGVTMARKVFVRLTWKAAAMYGLCGLALYPFRLDLKEAIQYAENNWIAPTYISPSDTSAWALYQYEAHLEKQVTPDEADIVKRRTREIAARVGSTPLAIYEVAYSECGLNPFVIRTDGVAAGWIQFTRAGLSGLGVSLEEVKAACHRRDAAFIMGLTERYLVMAANGHALPTSTEVYTAVFAPSFVGREESCMLYQGRNKPSYFLNAGLDGHKYRREGNRIVWYRDPDGTITIKDLRLALMAKRAKFLKG